MTLSLRQARRLKEKTQNEMAKLLNVHPMTYRKIEENPDTATIEQAKKIADYLGVNLDEIFFAREPQLN
ncbi:MAG: helix-turn-helix transcriptional regulator [Selenomonadaceae bacterium]|nr:helix-turn-helix transcriptional regulator [Selenomonadaceae bacterium]